MASEIKANKISPATGTAFTIGDSGDTLTLPSGATLSGAGAITIPSGGALTIDSGATITNNGTSGGGFGLFTSYAVIADQKTTAANGGTATSGAWRTRDLNTEISDPDGIVSIASNQFTLGSGNYFISWSAPAYIVDQHQTRLWNVSDSAEEFVGTTEFSQDSSSYAMTESLGSGRVSITSSKTFEIQHRVRATYATQGFGVGSQNTWGVVQFTTVKIFKEA